MKKVAVLAVCLFSFTSFAAFGDDKGLSPELTALSKFVGGKWVSEGQIPIVQEWTWNRDKKGFSVQAEIAKGTPNEMFSRAFFGWDPVAKKPYYLDLHDSELTYYGHVSLKDGNLEFRFGQLGSGQQNWVERGSFVGEDEWKATLYQIKDSKEVPVLNFVLKRKR